MASSESRTRWHSATWRTSLCHPRAFSPPEMIDVQVFFCRSQASRRHQHALARGSLELRTPECSPLSSPRAAMGGVIRASPVTTEGGNPVYAMARRPCSEPAKTREHDGTVLPGDAAPIHLGRGWLREHLRRLFDHSGELFVDFSFEQDKAPWSRPFRHFLVAALRAARRAVA